MPELPEVETVVRTLRPRLVGRKVRDVWSSGQALRMRRTVAVDDLRALCRGVRVAAVSRRAKYIVIALARRRPVAKLVVHLGMTGRLRVEDHASKRAKHTHVTWLLDDGSELRFVDPRRFGCVLVAADGVALPELGGLGPDALTELEPKAFAAALATSKAPIKVFLLDQRRIAGLGNIYACEALFRARIHPRAPARRAVGRAAELATAIHATLELAIANCGTSFRDFVDANGEAGSNLGALLVYGREGQPCRRCGGTIRRNVDAGRSTFFCPRCQKR